MLAIIVNSYERKCLKRTKLLNYYLREAWLNREVHIFGVGLLKQ